MRLTLLCLLLAVTAVAAVPNLNVCSTEQVQLELRPLGTASGRTANGLLNDYQLAFVALDNKLSQNKADWIDIHYRSASTVGTLAECGHETCRSGRSVSDLTSLVCPLSSVNNEDSVNLRVLTEAAIIGDRNLAKQAQVDGIQLEGGQTGESALCEPHFAVSVTDSCPLVACALR
jgi:hypothetical protein